MKTERYFNFGSSSPHRVRTAKNLRSLYSHASLRSLYNHSKKHEKPMPAKDINSNVPYLKILEIVRPTLLERSMQIVLFVLVVDLLYVAGTFWNSYTNGLFPDKWVPLAYLFVIVLALLVLIFWYMYSDIRTNRLWRFYKLSANCPCEQPTPLSPFWYPRPDCCIHYSSDSTKSRS